jgi:hypothetical protein
MMRLAGLGPSSLSTTPKRKEINTKTNRSIKICPRKHDKKSNYRQMTIRTYNQIKKNGFA